MGGSHPHLTRHGDSTMLMRLLDWLCARWLRRYEGDLPVSKTITTATVINAATVAPVQESPAFIKNEQREILNTPLADALSKPIVLPDVPKQTVTVKGEWEQQTKDYGVSVEADVDIGKPGGWSTGGKGGYWKDKGAAVMGWFQWKGKR
jgi:hypothetical protein